MSQADGSMVLYEVQLSIKLPMLTQPFLEWDPPCCEAHVYEYGL